MLICALLLHLQQANWVLFSGYLYFGSEDRALCIRQTELAPTGVLFLCILCGPAAIRCHKEEQCTENQF